MSQIPSHTFMKEVNTLSPVSFSFALGLSLLDPLPSLSIISLSLYTKVLNSFLFSLYA
jgi:hypothetical protein